MRSQNYKPNGLVLVMHGSLLQEHPPSIPSKARPVEKGTGTLTIVVCTIGHVPSFPCLQYQLKRIRPEPSVAADPPY